MKYSPCIGPNPYAGDLLDIFQTNPGTLASIIEVKISQEPDNSDYYCLLVQAYEADERKDSQKRDDEIS